MFPRITRNVIVDLLVVTFGLGSWITVNGLWVELPQLVLHLPEGWNLPSYLSVIVQLANIGPIAYAILSSVTRPSRVKDVAAVSATTVIGALACLFLAAFWTETAVVAGEDHSVALFVLVFFMALVDCTSSVLFLPFMATFKSKYITSYLVGEGLSGFVPSLMALIQGVGGNPECRNVSVGNATTYTSVPHYPEPAFSTSSFFLLLFAMDIMSLLAFFMLICLPMARKERDNSESTTLAMESTTTMAGSEHDGPKTASNFQGTLCLLLLQAYLCALSNGVFTSVQSFSCLPYGNRAFLLSVTLATMANPIACCISFVFPTRRTTTISVFTIVGTAIGSYIMFTAVSSPSPPLVGTTLGEVIVVISWVIFSGLFSYAKACVASVLRGEGRRALFWCGVVTQGGSAIGAIAMFVLINVFHLFQGFYPCTN